MSRPAYKRVARVALVLFTGLVAILGALGLYLSSDAFLETVRGQAVSAANASLNATLEIDALEGSVFGGLTARGVRLTAPDGVRLAEVPSVVVDYDLWSALSGTLEITAVELNEPVVDVVVKDGVTAWQTLAKPGDTSKTDPPAFTIDVRAVHVRQGRVGFVDRTKLPGEGIARQDELDPQGEAIGALVVVTNLNVDAQATIHLDGDTVVRVSTIAANLAVHGVGTHALSVADVSVTAGADLVVAAKALEWTDLVSISNVHGRLSAGTLRDTRVDIVVPQTVSPLLERLTGYALQRDLTAHLEAEGPVAGPTVGGHIDAGEGGRVEFSGSPDPSAWKATITASKLSPQAIVSPSPIEAQVSGTVEANGDSFDVLTGNIAARVALKPSRFDLYYVTALQADLVAKDGVVTAKDLRIDTPYASGSGNASFGLQSGEFALRAALEGQKELTTALPQLAKNQDVRVSGDIKASGTLDLAAQDLYGTVQQLDVAANWHLQNFEAEDVRVPTSTGTVTLSLLPADDERARIALRADVSARGIKSRKVKLTSLDARVRANGEAAWPPTTPEALLQELKASVDLNTVGLHAPGINVDRLNIQASATPGSKNSLTWSLRGEGQGLLAGDARAQSARADIKGSATLDPKKSGTAMLRRIAVVGSAGATGVKVGSATVGEAAVELDVSGVPHNLTGSAEVAATDVNVPNYAFDKLNATVTLSPNRGFVLDVRATQPDAIPAQFDATIHGKYRADFSGWDIDDVNLRAGEGDWAIKNGARIDTKRGIFEFDHVTLTHKDQSIAIHGSFRRGRDQDLDVTFDNFSIADGPRQFGLPGVPDVSGRVSGRAKAGGDARRPTFEFDLTFKDLRFAEYGPLEVHVAGSYDRDSLELTALEVDGYGQRLLTAAAKLPVHLETSGNYEIFWNEAFSVALFSKDLDLAAFQAAVPALAASSVVGKVSVDLTLEGKLEEPKLDVSLDVAGLSATLAGESEETEVGPLELTATTTYRTPQGSANGLSFDLRLRDKDGEGVGLRGAAAFPVAKLIKDSLTGVATDKLRESVVKSPFSLALLIRDYDIQRLNISAVKKAKAEGRVTLLLTMDGTPEDPRGKLRGRLAGFGWDRFRDIFFDIEADLSEQLLKLNKFRLEWDADEVLTGRAAIPVPMQVILGKRALEDLPLDLEVRIPSLPIAKLSAVDYTFASIRGKMQALFSLQGSLSKPVITANARLQDTLFANRKTGNILIEALGRDNRFTALAEVQHGDKVVATLRADAPVLLDALSLAAGSDPRLPGDIRIGLSADTVDIAGLFPPRVLEDVIDNVKGTMTSDLAVTGSWENPTLGGKLRVQNFNAFFPSIGRKVEDATMLLEAADGGLNLVEFYAAENQGYIDAQGRIDLEKLLPTRLAIALNLSEFGTSGFTPMPTYVSASMWSELDLTQEEKDIRLGINDLIINVPENQTGSTHAMKLDGDIVVVDSRKPEVETLGSLSQSQAAPVLAKIQVDIAPGAQLRHPNAQVEFQGKLAVDVAGAQTAVFGDIQSTGGKIEFLGKQFRVDQGIVTFGGNTPPNPSIQVEASYLFDRSVGDELGPASSGDPRAVVRVYGTALRPQLRLSSDPQLTESQIIYVLVSDRAPAAAQAGEEEGVASQAIAAASGLLSGMLRERAKSVYPIDMLRLQTTEGTISGVQVGKYFGKDLFFAYEFIFGADEGENTNEVRLEYQFAPRWLLGTRFGDQANGALFLYWNVY